MAEKRDAVSFDNIGNDLALSVFSFVASTPMTENKRNRDPCTLVDVLPRVSKLWHELSQHDYIWKPLLIQKLETEYDLWREGLCKLIRANQSDSKLENESNDALLEKARKIIGKEFGVYRNIYRQVVSKHIRVTSPVFYMRGHVLLGDTYRLHLFEPRYRLLIAELMEDYPREARTGSKIIPGPNRTPPLFIHANRDHVAPCTPACLVQIVRCHISDRDNTADVTLLPIAYVWMEQVWVRPNSFNLHYAQCLRMGSKATREMYELVNNEALESVMSRAFDSDYYWETSDDELDLDGAGELE